MYVCYHKSTIQFHIQFFHCSHVSNSNVKFHSVSFFSFIYVVFFPFNSYNLLYCLESNPWD